MEEENKKRVFAYTRVSKMLEDKLSTETQIEEIQKLCNAKNYELIKVYSDENLSGSETKFRDSFNEMFKDIAKQTYGKIDIVICYNISRFSRSVQDLNIYTNKLKDLGCGFRSVQEQNIDTTTPSGGFLFNIFGALAEFEREKLISVISDVNVSRAHIGGRWSNGGVAPYGYKKENKTIVPEEGTSDIVKDIFYWYVVDDISIKGITNKLNRSDIDNERFDVDISKYRKDKRLNEIGEKVLWNTSKIARVLENPAYIGINVTNRRKKCKSVNGMTTHKKNDVYKWEWSNNFKIINLDEEHFWNSAFEITQTDFEPLIDLDTFIKAQKKREEYNKWEPKRDHTDYLLAGYLYCGNCGRRMNGKRDLKKQGKAYYWYACNTKISKGKEICNMKNIQCAFIDDYVIAALADKVIMQQVVNIIDELDSGPNEQELLREQKIEDTKLQIRQCENAINRLYKFIMSDEELDDLSMKMTKQKLNTEVRQKEQLELQLKQIETEKLVLKDVSVVDRNKLLEKWLNFDFTDLSFDTMRAFIETWVERVIFYDKDHIEIYLKFDKTTNLMNDKFYDIMIRQRMSNLKRQRHKNEFVKVVKELLNSGVAKVKNGILLGVDGLSQYCNEPLQMRLLWGRTSQMHLYTGRHQSVPEPDFRSAFRPD